MAALIPLALVAPVLYGLAGNAVAKWVRQGWIPSRFCSARQWSAP